MVTAGMGEEIALYTLSTTMLERPRAMSRLRLPIGMSDSILQRASGKALGERSGTAPQGRSGSGGDVSGASHSGLRSPKQFPGAIPGHSPTTWRKPGAPGTPRSIPMVDPGEPQVPKHQPALAELQYQQLHHAPHPSSMQPTPHQVQQIAAAALSGEASRSKTMSVGLPGMTAAGGGAASSSGLAVPMPGTLSIITHVLETQAQPAPQTGWSPPTKTQPPRGAFRNARQIPPSSVFPRTPSPAVLQYINAASAGGPIPAHLQPGNHRQAASTSVGGGVITGASVSGGVALSVTGSVQGGTGGRRQSLPQRQSSHNHHQQQQQQQQQEQQVEGPLEAWPSIHSEPSGRREAEENGKGGTNDMNGGSSNCSSENGGVPLPPVSLSCGGITHTLSTLRRRSSSIAGGAAGSEAGPIAPAANVHTTVVGPSTPLHVAKLQTSAWATDPAAVITPAAQMIAAGSVSNGGGSSGGGLYVFRNTGRSALLAAAEVGLIGMGSLPGNISGEREQQFAPAYRSPSHGGMGPLRHFGTEGLADGDMGSLAWRIIVRYCRRRRLSGAFKRWLDLVDKLQAARQGAEAMRRKGELALMMATFTGWLKRVWRRQQQRRNLARATRRRLRVYLAAWREQSAAQADAYRLWLLEQVVAVCPQVLGDEGHGMIRTLHQRQGEYQERFHARQQMEDGITDISAEAGTEEMEMEVKAVRGMTEPLVEVGVDVVVTEEVEKEDMWGTVAQAIRGPEIEMDLAPRLELQAEADMESEAEGEGEAGTVAVADGAALRGVAGTEETEAGVPPHASGEGAEGEPEAMMMQEQESGRVVEAVAAGQLRTAEAEEQEGAAPGGMRTLTAEAASPAEASAREVCAVEGVLGAEEGDEDATATPVNAEMGRRVGGTDAATLELAVTQGQQEAEGRGMLSEASVGVAYEVSLRMGSVGPLEEADGAITAAAEGAEASLQFAVKGRERLVGQEEGLVTEWSEGLGVLDRAASQARAQKSAWHDPGALGAGPEAEGGEIHGGEPELDLGHEEAANSVDGQEVDDEEEVKRAVKLEAEGAEGGDDGHGGYGVYSYPGGDQGEDYDDGGGGGGGYNDDGGNGGDPADVKASDLPDGEAVTEYSGLGGTWEASGSYRQEDSPALPAGEGSVSDDNVDGGIDQEEDGAGYMQ